MPLRRFLSVSAVAALFGSWAIAPLAAQDCSGDYEYVEQDCAGSSSGWLGQRPIRVKVVVRRPKFLMAPLAPAAPAGYALPAPAPAAPAYAAPAMAMPMFTMMAAPAMAAPAYYQPTAAPAAAPAAAAPSLTDEQLKRLAELLAAAAAAPAKPTPAPAATCAPAAASAGLFRNCSESSGEIQQLRRDVDDLIKVTNRLTAVVEKLAEKHVPNP